MKGNQCELTPFLLASFWVILNWGKRDAIISGWQACCIASILSRSNRGQKGLLWEGVNAGRNHFNKQKPACVAIKQPPITVSLAGKLH